MSGNERIAELNAQRDRSRQPLRALCYAPHVQLSFDPTGAVSVCCLSRTEPVGNVTTQSLREIWEGARIRAYRQALEQDLFPKGCECCRWELEAGNMRNHPLLDFDSMPMDPTLRWPTRLEFALTNQCNLACVHCRPGLSSTIAALEGHAPMPRVYGDSFFAELATFLPHVRSLSFLGGEPFLQPECFRIFEMLIAGALKPGIFVTTNGTIWNRQVERVLEELPIDVAVSLDGVRPETIRSIRVGARPELLLRNVQRFRDAVLRRRAGTVSKDEFVISLNFCLMRRNWREMADFFLMAEDLDCRIWVTPVIWPRHQSLFVLPARAQQAVATLLEQQSERILPRLRRNATAWTQIVAVVQSEAVKAHLRENPPPPSPMVEAWQAMGRGDLEAASAAAGRTPTDDPYYVSSLVLRGSLLSDHGQLDAAESLLADAAAIDADDPELLLRRAWLRFRQQRWQEGLADATRLEAELERREGVAPHLEPGLLSVRANLRTATGDREGALADVERLLVLTPEDRNARAFRDHFQSGGA